MEGVKNSDAQLVRRRRKEENRKVKKLKKLVKKGKIRISLITFTREFLPQHGVSLSEIPQLDKARKSWMRNHVSEVLGTQQPCFTLRTSFTTLTTSGTNLTQVVAMDVTGISPWSSLANLFDEYRVKKAVLKCVPTYAGYGASATTLAAMPVLVVVDYDDSTALGSLAAAIQYDTAKIIYFGGSNPKTQDSAIAKPEGQPDLAWVTTASATVPFWWKFWSITTLVPSTAAMGSCYIEAEVEFRQVA